MSQNKNNNSMNKITFPYRLYELLEGSFGQFQEILRWKSNGLSFGIYDIERLEIDVLPVIFQRKPCCCFLPIFFTPQFTLLPSFHLVLPSLRIKMDFFPKTIEFLWFSESSSFLDGSYHLFPSFFPTTKL